MKYKMIHVFWAAAGAIATQRLGCASGHGPLFGMATPTNVKGGFSLDFGLMGRTGASAQKVWKNRATAPYTVAAR